MLKALLEAKRAINVAMERTRMVKFVYRSKGMSITAIFRPDCERKKSEGAAPVA